MLNLTTMLDKVLYLASLQVLWVACDIHLSTKQGKQNIDTRLKTDCEHRNHSITYHSDTRSHICGYFPYYIFG